jgi:hypothetical protein
MRPISIGSNPTAATATTLYTVPKGYYASLVRIHATNATASNKHITVSWYDSSAATTYNLLFEYTVTSKTYIDLDSGTIAVLEENDTLSVTTETGATYAVVVTFEIEGNQRA